MVDQCAGIASSVFSRGRQRPKPTMKRRLLRGARNARLSCLAFVLLGFSQLVKAQPIVINSNFSLAVFAKAPTGLTNPDSITPMLREKSLWSTLTPLSPMEPAAIARLCDSTLLAQF